MKSSCLIKVVFKEKLVMGKYRFIDNITTLYVFIMTFIVSFILSWAQNNDVNLSGENYCFFICGFWGSAICIVIRYVLLYRRAIFQSNMIRKTLMLVYLIVGNIVFAIILVGILFLSNFSMKHDILSYYNACQIIMFVILLSQWLGEQLLGSKINID